MGIKFKIDRNAQRTLGIRVQNGRIVRDTSTLVPEVRKEFRKKGPTQARKKVLSDLSKGISPVEGFGKFKPYSKSYKKVINKKGMFRKIGGRTVFFEGVEDPNLAAANPKKRSNKVTLRFTGQLYNALKVYTSGGFTEKFKLVFDWRDFLAEIHNEKGAGKSKVVRRMLPTKAGEEFNSEITSTILDYLNRAAKVIARRFS